MIKSIAIYLLLSVLLHACITMSVIQSSRASYIKPKVSKLAFVGMDSTCNLIVNYEGFITKHKSKPYHLVIPMADLMLAESLDTVGTEWASARALYPATEGQEKAMLLIAYPKEAHREGFADTSQLTPFSGNYWQEDHWQGYEHDLGIDWEGIPLVFIYEPDHTWSSQYQQLGVFIEGREKNNSAKLFLLPLAVAGDVLFGAVYVLLLNLG